MYDEKTRVQIAEDLGKYHLAIHPKYHYVFFQQEFIAPAVQAAIEHEIEALMILMPFRHGKTDVGTLTATSYSFGRWPERKNMCLSYSDKFAKRFGKKIIDNIRSEAHQEVFPECRLSASARSGSYFTTTQGGEFYSAGFNGTITGQGVTGCLFIDDPLKNIEEAKSPAIMKSRMDDYDSAANTRLEGGSIVLCTNRWCRGDFVDRLLDKEGEVAQGGRWTVLKLPAEAVDNDPLGRNVGDFLWPERLGEQWYENHRKKAYIWLPMCQQDPQAQQGKFFKEEWLSFYRKPVRPGRYPTFMITDPGKGLGLEHDFNATGVFCTTPERRILWVDASIGRFDPEHKMREYIRLVRKWQPKRWIYEELGLVNDTWHISEALREQGIRLRPIPVGRKGPRHAIAKEDRIRELDADIMNGKLCFPDIYGDKESNYPPVPFARMQPDPEDPEEVNVIQYFIDNEYLNYAGEGSVPHDDILDMLSRLHEPELGLSFPSGAPLDATAQFVKPSRGRKLGWEAVL